MLSKVLIMEALIIGAIVGAGYMLNKDGLQRDKIVKADSKTLPQNVPNGKNIFESDRVLENRKIEQKQADDLYQKSKNSEDTNVMIAGPPQPIFNKVDYSNTNLPIEFNDEFNKGNKYSELLLDSAKQQQKSRKVSNELANNTYVTGEPTANGWKNMDLDTYGPIPSLTGNLVDAANFKHNNMVPFFGGSIKQSVDDTAHKQVFENMTGTNYNYQEKKEIKPMFEPKANFTNINGMQNFNQINRDRYYVSNIMNNVTPAEKVYVGPGLNKGYTSAPSGGFQQADTRDYVLPKTVDQLRTKTNPKVSYHGRVLAGQKISRPGKIGTVVKNNPDTFYVHGHDRLFTTTGACEGARQRPKIVIKYTNRKSTDTKNRIGAAAPTTGGKERRRAKVRITRKVQNGSLGMRNADATGTWNSCKYDYGKKGIKLIRTNRQTLGQCEVNKNMQNTSGSKRNTNNVNPTLRRTRKTNVTGNPHWASNVQAPHNRHKVYDPNDVPRTTIKETNIHNTRDGNMSTQQPSKPSVYDPNDVPRTTIKETNIHNTRDGNMSTQQPSKPSVYDPNDLPKTTIKETTIEDDRFGQVGNSQLIENYVHDPDDVARPTIKQTTIDDNHFGPADAPDSKYGGYQTNPKTAPTTHRETQLSSYTGDPNTPGTDGYQIANVDMKNTSRQFTTTDYTGTASAVDNQAPTSRKEYENAVTNSNRQEVSKGRAPPPSGPKTYVSGKDINASTNRDTSTTNKKLNSRGVITTRVTNSIPQADQCGVTQQKTTLPNKPLDDRLDPSILDAYHENPYTQSLHSAPFN